MDRITYSKYLTERDVRDKRQLYPTFGGLSSKDGSKTKTRDGRCFKLNVRFLKVIFIDI